MNIYNTTKRTFIAIASLFIICILAVFFCFFSSHPISYRNRQSKKAEDLQRISSETYDGIFLSMYSPDAFQEEDFSTYRGLDILKCSHTAVSMSDISDYLEAVFSTENTVTNIYIGIEPLQTWNFSRKDIDLWNTALEENLLPYLAAHPDTGFEILFSYPSMDYWSKRTSEQYESWTATCRYLVDTLSIFPNFTAYFPGAEHWLISNPANYTGSFSVNTEVAQKLFLFTFCDRNFQMTSGNADYFFEKLETMITAEKASPVKYADLSDWSIVFFGDSVIGNYEGSYSIPGVIAGLSHAKVYNCGKGGVTASAVPGSTMNFPLAAELFVQKDAALIPEGGPYRASMEEYLKTDQSGQNLCFVINYGLNDYFWGYEIANSSDAYDATTYCGALRTGIQTLQNAYPDAVIILATPNFITLFSSGTETAGEKGGQLSEYVEAALQVAEELKVPCLNTYQALGYNAANAGNYLADGCHLNEEGRFLFGTAIIYFLEDLISQEKTP